MPTRVPDDTHVQFHKEVLRDFVSSCDFFWNGFARFFGNGYIRFSHEGTKTQSLFLNREGKHSLVIFEKGTG